MKKTLLLLLLAFVASQAVAQDTIEITVCKHFWKTGEPINGDGFGLFEYDPANPFGDAIIFVVDSNESCIKVPFYSLDSFQSDYVRCLEAYKIDNYQNGVTVLDLIAISGHILGLEPLQSIYAMLAADVNMSGSITTFDIVQLRKIVLGTADTLQAPAWRFFGETCIFPNPNNPFQGSSCPCILNQEMPSWDGETLDFTGIKAGDVDGDANPNGQFFGPPTADSIVLVLPDITLTPNTPISIPVNFEGSNGLVGMQVEFQLDTSKAKLDSISGAGFMVAAPFWTQSPDGRFRVVLFDQFNSVPNTSALFKIHITAYEPVALEDLIKIKKNSLVPLAASGDQNKPLSIGSKFFGPLAVQNPASNLSVSPASPNPFFDKTHINVKLENAERVLLEIADLTGRQIFVSEQSLGAGEHRLEVPAFAMPSGSVCIYKVQAGQGVATGKLTRL